MPCQECTRLIDDLDAKLHGLISARAAMVAAAPNDTAMYERLKLATDYSRINCELVRVELKHRVSHPWGY